MMKECHTVAQVYGFLSPVKLQTSQFKEDIVNSESNKSSKYSKQKSNKNRQR